MPLRPPPRFRAPLARLAAAGATLALAACASWRPLPAPEWERATAHADIFTTRLRVTMRDGRRLYVEQPRWTAERLEGEYPAGWPAVAARDSVLRLPRDSIVQVERLESSRGRTALYMAILAAVGVAALAR